MVNPFIAGLALTAVVLAGTAPASGQDAASQPAAVLEIDPARPFGEIDTNLWYLAEYLSGSQKDAARWRWVGSLSEADRSEMRARCDRITTDPARFDRDTELICATVYQVLNRN